MFVCLTISLIIVFACINRLLSGWKRKRSRWIITGNEENDTISQCYVRHQSVGGQTVHSIRYDHHHRPHVDYDTCKRPPIRSDCTRNDSPKTPRVIYESPMAKLDAIPWKKTSIVVLLLPCLRSDWHCEKWGRNGPDKITAGNFASDLSGRDLTMKK